MICEVHPEGVEPHTASVVFDRKNWCDDCFKALKAEIKRRAKAKGLPANALMVKLAMLKVGKEGNRPDPTKRFG